MKKLQGLLDMYEAEVMKLAELNLSHSNDRAITVQAGFAEMARNKVVRFVEQMLMEGEYGN